MPWGDRGHVAEPRLPHPVVPSGAGSAALTMLSDVALQPSCRAEILVLTYHLWNLGRVALHL